MAIGDSFLAAFNQAQSNAMQRERNAIARENMEANRDYYKQRNELEKEAQDALQKTPDAQNRIARFFSTDTPFDLSSTSGELEPGWADFLTATNAQGVSQHHADREYIRQDEENNRRINLASSPIGNAIDAASRFDKTAKRMPSLPSPLSISDGTNVLAEAESQGVNPTDVIKTRMGSHDDKLLFMAQYMTDKLGPLFEGYELGRYMANPDGTYTPMVRQKGSDEAFMPMTENRTSEADDPVIKIPAEDLQKQFERAVQDDIALKGLHNPQAMFEQYNNYSDEMRRALERDGSVDAATDPYQGGGDFSMYHSPSADGAADDPVLNRIQTEQATAATREWMLKQTNWVNSDIVPYAADAIAELNLEELIQVAYENVGEEETDAFLAGIAEQQANNSTWGRRGGAPVVTGDMPTVLYNQGDDYYLQTHREIPTSDLTLIDAVKAGFTGDFPEAWEYIQANPSVVAEIGLWVLPTGGLLVAGGAKALKIAREGFKGIRAKYGAKVADMLEGLWKKTHTVPVQGRGRYGVVNKAGQYMIRQPGKKGVISAKEAAELGMTPNRRFSRWRTAQTAGVVGAGGEHIRRGIFEESPEEKNKRYLNNAENLLDEHNKIPWVNRVLNPDLNDNIERAEGFPDSTHLLRAEVDEDGTYGPVGNWYAFPEIIERDGKLVKLSSEEAWLHAMGDPDNRAIAFGTEGEEARRFAEGNYKTRAFVNHFAHRHEQEGALRGLIGPAQEARQAENERQIEDYDRAEALRVAEAKYKLREFDAIEEAESSMVAEQLNVALENEFGPDQGQARTAYQVRKVLNELPPDDAMRAVWAIVANSPGLNQAQKMAMADDMIAGLQTGQIGMTPYDVRSEEREDVKVMQQQQQLDQNADQINLQRNRDRRAVLDEGRRRMEWNLTRIDNNEQELRLRDALTVEQERLFISQKTYFDNQIKNQRTVTTEVRNVVRPLVDGISEWLINSYNGTPEKDAQGRDKVSSGTNTSRIRSLIRLASSPTETPEIIAAAQGSLAEILALVIVHEGKDNPQDGLIERIWRRRDDMSIHEIANNLVRSKDGSKIAFKQEGKFDVELGEVSVQSLRAIIGDGMLREILENLPPEEF